MEKLYKKFYKRGLILWIIFFLVSWGILIIFNFSDLVESSVSNLLDYGLVAFISSCFFTVGIVCSLMILSPINIKAPVEERMRQIKEHNISFKLVSLFLFIIPIFLMVLWGMLWVRFPNILNSVLPSWQVVVGSILLSAIVSLLAILLIKYMIKNYDKNGDQEKKRFSSRDY